MTHGVHIAADLGLIPGDRLDYGLTLIDRAAGAGADSVVVGYAPPYMVMLPYTEMGGVNPDFGRLATTMLSRQSLLALRNRADQLGLQMGLRVYDGESGRLAVELGMAYLRIASGDLVNDRLLRSLAETGYRLVLGTAMASLAEIERALYVLWRAGVADLTLLHGVSVGAEQWERLNLAILPVLQRMVGAPVGLIDRFDDDRVPGLAIGAGIVWVERGLAIGGIEEAGLLTEVHALSPDPFAAYVAGLRRCDAAMRWRWPKVGEAERAIANQQRRGLYAARKLEVGDCLGVADILAVRPTALMGVEHFDSLLGCTMRVTMARFAPFEPDMLLQPWLPPTATIG